MSSQNKKKTAFARTPRGKGREAEKAPAQIQVNKQFLDKITQARIAPDMATVLTKTSATLNIEIQPNGKGNFTVNSAGKVIGDSTDIQKVQALGTFINDERKAIIKTSVSAMAKKTIAAIVMVSRDTAFREQVPAAITKIDKTFVDVFRTISNEADMLNSNLQLVNQTEAVGPVNSTIRNHLIETGARIRECFGSYLLYRAGLLEGDEPRKINDFLLEKGVINSVFTKLTSQKMQVGTKDFEFRKLYFPKDPTKGLTITLKELKDDDLRNNQGGILAGMKAYQPMWSDSTIRKLCGLPEDWDLDNLDGPAKVLANVPFMVVPFSGAVTTEEFITLLAKEGDRGLAWNVGTTVSPQDILRFLGTIPKRIAYGFIGKPRFSAPWYEILFPGFRFDANVIDKDDRSMFAQLQTQFRAGQVRTGYFATARSEGTVAQNAAVIGPLVISVLDMPPSSSVAQELISAFSAEMPAIPNGEIAVITDSWAAIMTRRNMTDEVCATTLQGVLAITLDPKGKDARTSDVRMARSGLSPAGSQLIREFRRRGYIALASRVDQWLRSFLTTELQSAVAEVMSARLEASLATPIKFDRGDTVVFLEPTEFPDDNAEENTEEAEAESEAKSADEAINPDDN